MAIVASPSIYTRALAAVHHDIKRHDCSIQKILLMRTVPIQLFTELHAACAEIFPQAERVVMTAVPIPHDSLPGAQIIDYAFGPYFDHHAANETWYRQIGLYDVVIIPYPTNVLAGYDNVKQFILPLLKNECLEIGCGGSYTIKSKPDLQHDVNQGAGTLGTIAKWAPSYVTINITEHCNLRCVMCDIDDEAEYPSMTLDDFKQVAGKLLPDCRVLTLNGYVGEPLLHPQFADIINYIDSRWPDIAIGFATNATAFTAKRISTVLSSNCIKDIRISLSAAHKDTYERIMKRGRYELTMRRLHAFMRARSALPQQQRPMVTLSFVAMKENIHELPDFIALAADIGAQRVLVWDVQISQVNNLAYSLRGERERTAAYFEQAKSAAKESGINLLLPDAYEARDELTGSAGGDKQAFRCLLPWSHMYVSPDGDVAPCCFFNKSMGNLLRDKIDEVWNGQAYQQLRDATESGQYPIPCRSCPENRMLARGQPQFVEHKNKLGAQVYQQQVVSLR